MSREQYKFAQTIGNVASPVTVTGDWEGAGRAIYVGVAGHIGVQHKDGRSVKYLNVPVGVFPVAHTKVHGITASGLETTAKSLISLS